jgi:hypothetical protein
MDSWDTIPEIDIHSLPPSDEPKRRGEWVDQAIQRIFSAYRKDSFADPEGFRVQIGAVLETFPMEVVEHVTDPRNSSSIQRICKFPPSIAEVGDACEAELRWRQRVEAARALPPPERWEKPTYLGTQGDGGPGTVYSNYDEAVKKHGRPFGRFEQGRQLP